MNFGPQVNIGVPPGIMNESSSNPANQSWQGLTIKEILEKVDLSNIIMDEDKKKVVREPHREHLTLIILGLN